MSNIISSIILFYKRSFTSLFDIQRINNSLIVTLQTVVQAKLKLSTQEKAFMESRIRGDDNMEMEDDESMPDINNSDNTTPDDTTNNQSLDNNNLQSTSSPQLSPRKKKRQTVVDESDMHSMTKKKSRKSNDKEQQSHSKSYKRLKKDIIEVHKNVSALTSIVCKMDDTIKKQPLKLSEMKQMLERLLKVNFVFRKYLIVV